LGEPVVPQRKGLRIEGVGFDDVRPRVKILPVRALDFLRLRQAEQIVQALQQGTQSDAVTRFRDDFIAKWTSRTFCAESVLLDLCANAPPPPEACTSDDDSEREAADEATLEAGCPAPATPRNVINPGTGQLFPGEQVPALPQGPFKPTAAAPAGLPPGVAPIGPGGAPAPPPGAAPPGAPPQGAPPAP